MMYTLAPSSTTKVETNSTAKYAKTPNHQLQKNTFRSLAKFGATGSESIEQMKHLAMGLDKQLKNDYRNACELKKRNELAQFPNHQKHLPHPNSYANGFRR